MEVGFSASLPRWSSHDLILTNRRHVFGDLRPYKCLFSRCIDSNTDFERRHQWQRHVSQYHWRTWSCPFNCGHMFQSAVELGHHIRHQHLPNATEEQLNTVIARGEASVSDDLSNECPPCGHAVPGLKSYIKHVGRHLEQLALFALPSVEGEDLGDYVESDDDDLGDHVESDEDELGDYVGSDAKNDAASELESKLTDNGSPGASWRAAKDTTQRVSKYVLSVMSQILLSLTSSSPSDGKDWPIFCLHPDCGNARPFKRTADLQRHYKNTHGPESSKNTYFCDYPRCSRSSEPFHRRDHFRDHLREYHRENIQKRGPTDNEEWLEGRTWWRCPRCLIRVYLSKSGYECSNCQTSCEAKSKEKRRSWS
jgi:hypothetical protein